MKINEVTEKFATPDYELSDKARQAAKVAQMIKQKINSAPKMDDRDYNSLAELGAILSRLGTSFGPKSMKDIYQHMVQYTNDRNAEAKPKDKYPDMTPERFKELIAMAK